MPCHWIILIFIFFPAYYPCLLFLDLETRLRRRQVLIPTDRKAGPWLFEAAFLFLLRLPKWGKGFVIKVVVVRVSQVIVRVDACAGFVFSVSFVTGAHWIALSVLHDRSAVQFTNFLLLRIIVRNSFVTPNWFSSSYFGRITLDIETFFVQGVPSRNLGTLGVFCLFAGLFHFCALYFSHFGFHVNQIIVTSGFIFIFLNVEHKLIVKSVLAQFFMLPFEPIFFTLRQDFVRTYAFASGTILITLVIISVLVFIRVWFNDCAIWKLCFRLWLILIVAPIIKSLFIFDHPRMFKYLNHINSTKRILV